jgi:hypothetical protein
MFCSQAGNNIFPVREQLTVLRNANNAALLNIMRAFDEQAVDTHHPSLKSLGMPLYKGTENQ